MLKNRVAVSALFFVNGFIYANWTSRLPGIQQFLGLTNTSLGALLLVAASGALLAMPFTGWLTTRFGTRTIILLTSILFCIMVAFIPVYANAIYAGAILFVVGLSTGSMDVAMNGQAVIVERTYQKTIMSSFHAIFSIGMALGAGAGALFAKGKVPLHIHLPLICLGGITVLIFAYFFLIQDKPIKQQAGNKAFRLPTRAILPIGIIGFCGMTGEGAIADWSAIFMNKVVGQSEATSALAFGFFGAAMTLGRIFGDYFTNRLGKKNLLIIDGIMAILGLGIMLAFVGTWSTFLGLFIIGLGLSTVVPIVYSTAGNTEGVSPSVGIAMATTIGYSGFFIAPPLIGFLADQVGLRVALLFVLTLFFLMLWLSFGQFSPRKAE